MSLTPLQSLAPARAKSIRAPAPPELARPHTDVNVGSNERVASTVLGGVTMLWGLSKRGVGGTLATALGSALVYRGVSGHCHLYDALGIDHGDSLAATGQQRAAHRFEVLRSVTVQRPAAEVFRAWRDPETFAQAMGHFASHTTREGGRTEWTLHDPLGRAHSWETQIVEEEPGKRIRWQSVTGAPLLKNLTLELRPAPRDRGTEMMLHLRLDPPGGVLGAALRKLFGKTPGWVLDRALRNVKSLLEAGEIPSLHHNPAARASAHL